jgi:hypothetical protein
VREIDLFSGRVLMQKAYPLTGWFPPTSPGGRGFPPHSVRFVTGDSGLSTSPPISL